MEEENEGVTEKHKVNMALSEWGRLQELYNQTMAQADPRCDYYPMLGSPAKMLGLIGLYLFVVWQGPKWMEHHKPWDLRKTIVGYNLFMVLLNIYIFSKAVRGIIKAGGYSIICDSMEKYQVNEYNQVEYYYVSLGWFFFVSKLVEFFDTVFFILRKKNGQISFLHVYHHSTMVVFTWLGVKFIPGGTNIIYPLINGFIHVVMYTYYGLAAVGPSMRKYLWWKKHLTKMQMIQFMIFLTQGVINSMNDCKFPKIFVYAVFTYAFTVLLLFINFYVRAYLEESAQSKQSKQVNVEQNGGQATSTTNGDIKKLD